MTGLTNPGASALFNVNNHMHPTTGLINPGARALSNTNTNIHASTGLINHYLCKIYVYIHKQNRFVCIYIYTHIQIYISIDVCIHVHMYIRICIYTHIDMNVCTHISLHTLKPRQQTQHAVLFYAYYKYIIYYICKYILFWVRETGPFSTYGLLCAISAPRAFWREA